MSIFVNRRYPEIHTIEVGVSGSNLSTQTLHLEHAVIELWGVRVSEQSQSTMAVACVVIPNRPVQQDEPSSGVACLPVSTFLSSPCLSTLAMWATEKRAKIALFVPLQAAVSVSIIPGMRSQVTRVCRVSSLAGILVNGEDISEVCEFTRPQVATAALRTLCPPLVNNVLSGLLLSLYLNSVYTP